METVALVLEVVNDHPYLSLASVVISCGALVRSARQNSRSRLPPGPKGYPIVGNLFDLPPTHFWEKFSAWGRQYGGFSSPHLCRNPNFDAEVYLLDLAYLGEVAYINVLGQDMIILNSSKAAVELLDKRSAIYSDRPVLMMGGEIVGWKRTLALTQYGPRFREFRKFVGRWIGSRASMEKFMPLQEKETAKFVARVMSDPGSLVHQIRK